MTFKSDVLFSAKELQELVVVSEACVRVERQVRHIALLPACLRDVKSAIIGTLKSYKKKFDVSFSGFILGYKNVKLLSDKATLINDDPHLHFDIEADFYIFTPKVGCTLFGIVSQKGVNHISCLVHKCFHVVIPRLTKETDEEWLGTSVNMGDQVTFSVEAYDFKGCLPYIRGKLINLSSQCVTLMKEDAVDGTSEQQKKKKPKKDEESSECDHLFNNVEQEEMQPVLRTEHKKRKRHFEDEGETGAERKKKKKKKQEVKDYKSVNCQTQEEEDVYFTHLSSEDAFMTSQKLPVMDMVESDLCIIDTNCKAKKEKRKKCDLYNVKLSYAQNKNDKDEGETGAERKKKKKKKQEVEDYKSVNCQTQEEEDVYFTHLSSEDAFMTSQKLPVMDMVESDLCIIDTNCKAKKEKRKKRDLYNVKLSYAQNKNDKPTVKEDSLVDCDIPVQYQSLGCVTCNVEEAQVIAAPSVAGLLNRVKSKQKGKPPKKHKKKDDHDETKSDKSGSHLLAVSHGENKRKKSDKSHWKKKQHNSKKAKEKASVSFDPVDMLAEYILKFEETGKDDVANECHSSKEGVADSRTSNTSFRSSYCNTGAGMANAADRRRKKMNKGKGDAIPVRRSWPLPPSSRLCSAAYSPVGQDIVWSNSIESSIESPKSSADECGVLQTPEKCFTRNEVSRSPKNGISNKVKISLASPKEGLGSNLSSLSPKQVTSPEKTTFRSTLSRKGTSDSHLPTIASASSRKNLKEVSDVNSSMTKDRTPVSSGYTHYLNVVKVPTHAKSHGRVTVRELINASVILPHHSDVLQRLKFPSVGVRSAVMCELSPLQAKSLNEVSTDLVKEAVTNEIKNKLKKKKKQKEKKSKTKDKVGEHIERKQKKKNSQGHKTKKLH